MKATKLAVKVKGIMIDSIDSVILNRVMMDTVMWC
jgi:hypothetical protein